MKIDVKSNQNNKKTPCLVILVDDNLNLNKSGQLINKKSNNYIRDVLKKGDIKGKLGESLVLHDVPNVEAERILIIGYGSIKKMDLLNYKTLMNSVQSNLNSINVKSAVFSTELLCDIEFKDQVQACAEVLEYNEYQYSEIKKDKNSLQKVTINFDQVLTKNTIKEIKASLNIGFAISKGKNITRDLGNLPGNICTPTYLAKESKKYAKTYPKLKTTVLNEAQMKKLGMGSLLSISQGSRTPPKFIIMEYSGTKKSEKPHALVGKGVTFDTGGISLKPGGSMDEMKFDMCGAASVIGTMVTVNELNLPINLVVIVPTVENMPDGNAIKPGDVVTSMSGLTIEILNTDAEGRMILCDALTYSKKFKPQSVIDVATLTGAVVGALGHCTSGLLSNNQDLADKLLDAGQKTDDKAWQLPLWDEYQSDLDSNFADIANIGGRAGCITAACFLSRFTEDLKWAHLDIAGVANKSGGAKGATGRPVSLLTRYLMDLCPTPKIKKIKK